MGDIPEFRLRGVSQVSAKLFTKILDFRRDFLKYVLIPIGCDSLAPLGFCQILIKGVSDESTLDTWNAGMPYRAKLPGTNSSQRGSPCSYVRMAS